MQTSNTKDQNELIFALNHLFFVLRKTTPFSKNSSSFTCHSLWFLLQIEKPKRKVTPHAIKPAGGVYTLSPNMYKQLYFISTMNSIPHAVAFNLVFLHQDHD